MEDKTLNIKDSVWGEILTDFRTRNYGKSLKNSLDYFTDVLPVVQDFEVTSKDNANVVYTIACSAFGVQDNTDKLLQEEQTIFFQYLDTYVNLCIIEAKNTGLRGWFTGNPKTLLRDCLELLCRFEKPQLQEEIQKWVLKFASIDAPGWKYELALPVLREKIFNERIQFERSTYVSNTQALCEAYLDISEPVAESFGPGRTQIMNVLSDIAYYQGGEKGEDEALMWVKKALEVTPDDKFAVMRKKFIEERQTVLQQIRRFNHDTGNTMAGIKNRLDWLLEKPEVKHPKVEPYLLIIKKELRRIHGINRFIQDKMPALKEFDPYLMLKESILSFSRKVTINLSPENTGITWITDPEYLSIAVDNLLKNSIEAFERRKIPASERRIDFVIEFRECLLTIIDNAGGVDPDIRDRIFEPYVSSKGIKKETGLGLSSARLAMQKLKGDICLSDNQPENGAAFEIRL